MKVSQFDESFTYRAKLLGMPQHDKCGLDHLNIKGHRTNPQLAELQVHILKILLLN
jgi:hypothetical protein